MKKEEIMKMSDTELSTLKAMVIHEIAWREAIELIHRR